jgi:hypothetical protein
MATAVRLDAIWRMAFDAGLARLGGGRLTRVAAVTYLESASGLEDATLQMALAGVRVTRCSAVPTPTTDLRPAIAFDLMPLDAAFQAIDVIELQRIPLSDASAMLMRHRLPWSGRSRTARDACRRLLRDEDAILGWRRIVWSSVGSLRAARTCVRLRPVVFDRAAVERHPLRWTYVSDRAIEQWAFT